MAPPYDYKAVEWSKFDDLDPVEIINQETGTDWEYYDSIHIHDGRVHLIFRRASA